MEWSLKSPVELAVTVQVAGREHRVYVTLTTDDLIRHPQRILDAIGERVVFLYEEEEEEFGDPLPLDSPCEG